MGIRDIPGYKLINDVRLNLTKRFFPHMWRKRIYRGGTGGRKLNLKNPVDLNQKIQWLMSYTDTRLWTLLADKYRVREYVKDRVGEQYLIPLYGHWDKTEDIDFESLPDTFVMKPNNGCFDAVFCKKKSELDFDEVRSRLEASLRHKFGYEYGETHYTKIKPCIIAEEMLRTDNPLGLIDYKIWCFDGRPYSLCVCMNRDNDRNEVDFVYYDLNWNKLEHWVPKKYRNSAECPRPDNLDEMLRVASRLSEGLPQARVDLYNVDGKIYFGEMTMSSYHGVDPSYTEEALIELGSRLRLPERGRKEKWHTFLKRWLPQI